MRHIPRFFCSQKISKGDIEISSSQMQHAAKVLRLHEGDEVRVFNEKDGEWQCLLKNVRKNLVNSIKQVIKPRQEFGPCIACSLINPHRFAIMAEKVTELGATKIIPIIADFSQNKSFNLNKIYQIIIQASEQSRRLSVPELQEPITLREFLLKFSAQQKLYVGIASENEGVVAVNFDVNSTFLVGPEGGFSESEITSFKGYNFIQFFHLNGNILRTETAAIAFASIWLQQHS
ncbi:MAG: 16S rRNA (uracil(1498)-N(3))-methyltransferase [Alphaproteobacteria bacterium]|nr:16S rRNA (uracil(1498)-N(3))-methyltransferase [Alphaproteobacteria bacterium]